MTASASKDLGRFIQDDHVRLGDRNRYEKADAHYDVDEVHEGGRRLTPESRVRSNRFSLIT